MAGKLNDAAVHDYMTPMDLYRSLSVSDTDLTATEVIDLSASKLGSTSKIHLIGREDAAGAETWEGELYLVEQETKAHADIRTAEVLVATIATTDVLKLVVIENLPPGKYKLKVTISGGTIHLYEGHSL